MEIKNRSGIDFEIDYLNVSVVKANKRRKALYQSLDQEVVTLIIGWYDLRKFSKSKTKE